MDEELKALEGEAAQIDAQLAPTPTPEEGVQIAQPGNQNEAAELSALVQIVSGMFAPMFPSLKEIYTAQSCDALAAAAVPVMLKRGWSVSGLLGKYEEEVALLAIAGPLAFATWQGVTADLAKAAAVQKKTADDTITPQISSSEPAAPVQARA